LKNAYIFNCNKVKNQLINPRIEKIMTDIDFTFKIIMLGDASTGKTSISNKYINGTFNPHVKLTVGVDFYVKTMEIPTKRGKTVKIKLQIWDLGGETRFRFLLPTYCLGCSGAIFVYDLTRPETLASLNDWTTIVREKNGDIPIILVGNKSDLKENRKIPENHGVETAKQNNLHYFLEVSAKDGTNIENVFQNLTQDMLNRAIQYK
jgi:small GTP-binding protein